MAKKDMYHNIVVTPFASDTAIDLLGYNSFTFAAFLDAAGAMSFVVSESDDNATFTEVAAEKLLGETAVTSGKAVQFGYKGDCRYVKITATGTPDYMVAVLGVPAVAPVM